MSIYFSQPYDDIIKIYYEYSLKNEIPIDANSRLQALFTDRVKELKILEKFNEFVKKFNHFEGKSESKIEYQKQYNEMYFEYKNIIRKARDIWDFNYGLISSLELKYYEICDKTGKKGFTNINKEILDNQVNSYIKFDKDLIIIKNKINKLINLII